MIDEGFEHTETSWYTKGGGVGWGGWGGGGGGGGNWVIIRPDYGL